MNTQDSNITMPSDYVLKVAVLENAYEIWTLMDYCSQHLKQKDHFICDSQDYVKDVLDIATILLHISKKINRY